MLSELNKGGNTAHVDSVKPLELPVSNLSRVLPRQLSSGSTRGTQIVGYGKTKIDGTNNSITVGDTIFLDGNSGNITVGQNIRIDGSTNTIDIGEDIILDGINNIIQVGSSEGGTQGIGKIPDTDNQSGFFQTDSNGRVIYKLLNGTQYNYNLNDSYNNAILNGFAPDDGRPGIWVAKPGFSAYTLLGGS